ncbi:alanine dehydrogenase [Candidatus Desantisbacteria bacterium]|nr:alanine dehydrogenase [Candidatus Desantisbacteria bacterium]
MTKNKTLILDKKSIESLIDIKNSIKVIEDTFREYGMGKVLMPAKTYLDLKKYSGDFRAMPAYIETIDKCAIKWVNVHPENKKFHLPSVMAVIILSDPVNGMPLCIMEGGYITCIRTGAAGGVAAKYLARKDSEIIGMVGCGAQARTQLLALNMIFKIKEVKVWGNEKALVLNFIKDMKKLNLKLIHTEKIEDCVRESDIVVTTTPSRKPIVMLEWLKKGTHINAIGADAKGKQELDPVILKNAKVVIDSWEQASHSGEINVALSKGIISKKDIFADIGEVVSGKKKGRTNNNELTVFDSTGLAIQDVAVANLIYQAAIRKKIGRWIELV